jgi:carbon storage regulator
MLVLSRKVGEKIVIGEGVGKITVTVVEIDGNKIRLGIEAPRDVPVHRHEVAARIAAGFKPTLATANV